MYFSQIWLNVPVDRSHFGYITKLLRRGRGGGGSMANSFVGLFCQLFAASSNGKAWTTRRAIGAAVSISCRKRQGNKKKLAWQNGCQCQSSSSSEWVNFKLIMEQTGAQHSSLFAACRCSYGSDINTHTHTHRAVGPLHPTTPPAHVSVSQKELGVCLSQREGRSGYWMSPMRFPNPTADISFCSHLISKISPPSLPCCSTLKGGRGGVGRRRRRSPRRRRPTTTVEAGAWMHTWMNGWMSKCTWSQ